MRVKRGAWRGLKRNTVLERLIELCQQVYRATIGAE